VNEPTTEARLAVTGLLGRDRFTVDEERAHIAIDPEVCRACPHQACVAACPAGLFSRDEDGQVRFDHAGCLECGTCRVVCTPGGIVRWEYPRAGFGVTYTAS
jgi:ferredoxin like protein